MIQVKGFDRDMERAEESGSPSWSSSFYMPTSEDVARAVAAAAAAVRSPRPSVVYSSKEENGGQLKKLQHQVSRMLKGLSTPPEVKSSLYNPEILTSQKRQWANFQLQMLDHKVRKEPSKLFESMVVVGLPPSSDVQALQNLYLARKFEGPGKLRSALGSQNQCRIEPNLEPQVLFVYPPEKQLPLKYKDLLSFCFPNGVEVNAVERTPSMSELNEILLGQEHLKQSDLSFVFRLQVADSSTLYGCCVLVEEMIQKPSGLISTVSDGQPACSSRSRYILMTRRCYCILSRLPFFELHFGVLNSIFTEERLERLTKQINGLDLDSPVGCDMVETLEERAESLPLTDGAPNTHDGAVDSSESSTNDSISGSPINNISQFELHNGSDVPLDPEIEKLASWEEPAAEVDSPITDNLSAKQSFERRLPNSVLPFIRFRASPCEDRDFRCDYEEADAEEACSSGRDIFSEQSDILEWAKANNHGSLQIICEYYQLSYPARGSTIMFNPLGHLHPLEYHRPDESVLPIAGSKIDLRSCNTSLAFSEAHSALVVEEEAAALSVWAIACLCGTLRLEHVLTLFAGALLEKQIVIVCSNLGILSALVLSIIPLIRPYQWQSLLMPVLPNDMLDFLDAPVPYIVGVKNKTELQAKLTNVIVVDANKNQVKSPSLPQLPQQRELHSLLSPFHEKLVGESYLGKKRPIYECTDVQVKEAAKGFLYVLRSYLDSLCSNLRSHTITNVQSNDDKVSLLLKESFIESFPSRNRPFMKLFLDTQLFSVHTDFILSFFQKE
ncbi:hypothetical protein SASPL_112816 [Salvia splendens]|uniref:UDENN domain-containing protein n=1 Tax=Salvia splendens TaxID=180675 RepID=A0A8X9A6G1_SALSN|nr:hypothetical protein SASPL_112816 [Salvia splendens]